MLNAILCIIGLCACTIGYGLARGQFEHQFPDYNSPDYFRDEERLGIYFLKGLLGLVLGLGSFLCVFSGVTGFEGMHESLCLVILAFPFGYVMCYFGLMCRSAAYEWIVRFFVER